MQQDKKGDIKEKNVSEVDSRLRRRDASDVKHSFHLRVEQGAYGILENNPAIIGLCPALKDGAAGIPLAALNS